MTKRWAARDFLLRAMTTDSKECVFWPFNSDHNGAAIVRWNGTNRIAARVVCEDRHGPPPSPKYHAAHSCGKGHLGCINPSHLDWKTPLENNADMIAHGTRAVGEKNPRAKLRTEDVVKIRALRGLVTQRELAGRYGVSQAVVSKAQLGRTWSTT